jgi:hypothetical protein
MCSQSPDLLQSSALVPFTTNGLVTSPVKSRCVSIRKLILIGPSVDLRVHSTPSGGVTVKHGVINILPRCHDTRNKVKIIDAVIIKLQVDAMTAE